AALEPVHVAGALRDGAQVGVSIDGHDHELGPDDLLLALKPLEGYQLGREGLAREVVHAVQNARKAAGLEVEDRIELALGGDAELLDAARAHESYVAGETLALAVTYDGSEAAGAD